LTASITSGANLFAVANIQANNLELEDVSGELPGPHHGPAFVWQIVPAGTGNGTTPFALQKDQLLYLNVTARVPLNSIPPGDFTGAEGSESIVLSDVHHGTYKKLVIAEGRLTGAVLIGDVGDALWYLELIRSRQPTLRIRADMMFGRSLAIRSEAA